MATDKLGTLDTVEFFNVAQDDALSWPQITHRTYPATANARMQDTLIPFTQKSMAVNNTFLTIFERRLGLPEGTFAALHLTSVPSGSEARCIRTPPNQDKAGIGAHTDFGTLVIRHPFYVMKCPSLTLFCSPLSTIVSEAFKYFHLVPIHGYTSR